MGTTTDTITDEQIHALMSEVAGSGDVDQVMICRIALGLEHVSDVEATTEIVVRHNRDECARVIAAAEAMGD